MDNPGADGTGAVLSTKPRHAQSRSESTSKLTSTSAELDHTQPTHRTPASKLTPKSCSSQKFAGESSPDAEEPQKPTVIDYQSLPSPPDYGIDLVDDLLGQSVAIAYRLSCLQQTWREQMYGMEVASTSRRGWTPSPVRRAYAELMEREKRLDQLDTDEELSDEEDISKNDGKDESSRRLGETELHNDVSEANQPGKKEGPDSSHQAKLFPPCQLTDLCITLSGNSGQEVTGKVGTSAVDLASTRSPLRRHSTSRPTTSPKRRRECEGTEHHTSVYDFEKRGRKRFRESSVPPWAFMDRTSIADR
ncbi:hypothetical protein AJ80_09676 [Polytolypa hystricis UAMH7299]|uniref:Uncharacterized protein n=1 Tax=Polytolypa hystricis (strain UAMH7299) TaxID=1447883 RepID=A0A2B7WDP1_POLH7|nr:hypothetical protein AJ80_09676 [Polytolypa hystricis UAMH7299]